MYVILHSVLKTPNLFFLGGGGGGTCALTVTLGSVPPVMFVAYALKNCGDNCLAMFVLAVFWLLLLLLISSLLIDDVVRALLTNVLRPSPMTTLDLVIGCGRTLKLALTSDILRNCL